MDHVNWSMQHCVTWHYSAVLGGGIFWFVYGMLLYTAIWNIVLQQYFDALILTRYNKSYWILVRPVTWYCCTCTHTANFAVCVRVCTIGERQDFMTLQHCGHKIQVFQFDRGNSSHKHLWWHKYYYSDTGGCSGLSACTTFSTLCCTQNTVAIVVHTSSYCGAHRTQ